MNIENGDSAPYWAGVREGRLTFQRCVPCGHVQFPPGHICTRCWSDDLEWADSAGRGRVESFSIVQRAPTPELREKVPYVVAAVLLAEGPRMITNIVGAGALQVEIDDDVSVVFIEESEGRILPQFERRLG
jgi:hypothetical protein